MEHCHTHLLRLVSYDVAYGTQRLGWNGGVDGIQLLLI